LSKQAGGNKQACAEHRNTFEVLIHRLGFQLIFEISECEG